METAANMAHATDATTKQAVSVATSQSEGWPRLGATLAMSRHDFVDDEGYADRACPTDEPDSEA